LTFICGFNPTLGSTSTDGLQITTKQIRKQFKAKRVDLSAEYPKLIGKSSAGITGFNQNAKLRVMKELDEFKKHWINFPPANLKLLQGSNVFMKIGYHVEYTDNNLISVNFRTSRYSIKMSHVTDSFSINYDLKNGKELELADLFKHNTKYLEIISEHCLKELRSRKDNLKTPDISGIINTLASDDLTNAVAPETENFKKWNITPDGLMFSFNPYIVGPYPVEPEIIIVPYDKLKDMIKPNGILAQITQ
jgi:hypothetical protein